jgi:sodium/bile acid cotransporter 7
LLILIWSIFSNQFEQDAFNLVSSESIILVVFLNLALYLIFTALCVVCTRLPFLPAKLVDPNAPRVPRWRKIAAAARFSRPEATAICFCAAAKGLVVGSPILDILYGGMTPAHRAIISIPLVLYQGEHIACGQLLTYLFRKWNREEDPMMEDIEKSEKV